MSHAAPTPSDLTDLHLAQLARLAEIGMEIAEAAGRHARGMGEGEHAAADPALSFARAARAVRLTIALQQRLVADRAASARAEGAARAAEAVKRRDRIHSKIERALEQVAEAEGGDAEAAEHLSSVAWERLTETDDEDLLSLPIKEVVARICADLGLSPAFAIDAFGPSLPEGPLSHPAGDSSPTFVGEPRCAIASPTKVGEVAAEGGRRGLVVSPSPPPRRMSG